jgi:UDP-N-acetylmuramoyl-tripeptide--D-alanyl-D-alanine ligase
VDAYNANPTSMMAALENFRRMEVLHKMVILGDMKELGKSSHEEHQKIVSYIDECKFERVILVGEEFGQATSSYEHYQDARQLSEVLKKSKPKGFYILIKGSNSMKLAPLQELL